MRFSVVAFVAALFLGAVWALFGSPHLYDSAAASSAPAPAEAQPPPKMRRLAVMGTYPRPEDVNAYHLYNAFILELRNLGYVEGQNIVIEWRATEGRMELRRQVVSTLMAWKPDVIVGVTAADGEVFRDADPSIPVVLVGAGNDLVAAGLADTRAHPGRNVTGIQTQIAETAPRRLEILKELMPHLQSVAVVHVAPAAVGAAGRNHFVRLFDELDGASRAVSVRVHDFPVGPGDDLDRVFAQMKRVSGAAMLDTGPFLTGQGRDRLAALAARHALPVIYDNGRWVEEGGLVSYGPDLFPVWQRAAQMVDRIFKVERPADMAIEQPRKLELMINLRAARALNLTVPKHLLLLADRVIE